MKHIGTLALLCLADLNNLPVLAFSPLKPTILPQSRVSSSLKPLPAVPFLSDDVSRRSLIATAAGVVVTAATEACAAPAGDFLQDYDDFKKSPSGWSYKDSKPPSDTSKTAANVGDRVVFDWSGYTIGYFGRPFQARGGPQGGAFDKDPDYLRTVLGSGEMIPAVEEAMIGMKAGQIRQIIVPYGPLSYPDSDPEHVVKGPKPTTFSGQRALNFVLQNQAGTMDKTILINVKCIRVDQRGEGGKFSKGNV